MKIADVGIGICVGRAGIRDEEGIAHHCNAGAARDAVADCVVINEKCGFFRAGEGDCGFSFHVISSFLRRSNFLMLGA